jgi:predicted nucleotidyltransferase
MTLPNSLLGERTRADLDKRGKVDVAIEVAVVRDLVDQEVDATVHRVIVGHQTMRGRLLGLAARPRLDGSTAE